MDKINSAFQFETAERPFLQDMLEQSLNDLARAQLIRPLSEEEPTYQFKHALTQDAAYESLLLKTRRELHARVARAYEQLYADNLDEYAALLARHYDEAGDVDKTLEYSRRAGEAAARVNANLPAIAHFERAIEMARALSRTSGTMPEHLGETLRELYLRRGRLLELSGRYEQAVANYIEMQVEGEQRKDAGLLLAGMTEHAKLLSTPNPQWDWARGVQLAEQALVLARELKNRVAQARLLWILTLANMYGSVDLDRAARYGEESIRLAQELDLRELLAYCLNDLGHVYANQGQLHHGLAVLGEAERLWRELNNMPMLTDTLANESTGYFQLGDFQETLRVANEGFAIGQSIGNEWSQANCRMIVGQVYWEQGQFGRAIKTMQETIRLGDSSGHPGAPVSTRAMLAWALADLGAIEKGLEIAQQGVKWGARNPPFRPWALAALARLEFLHRDLESSTRHLQEAESIVRLLGSWLAPVFVMLARGEYELSRGNHDAVINGMDELVRFLSQIETRAFLYEALFLKAKGLLAHGQSDAAFEALQQAEIAAEAIGSRRSLWAILLMQSRLLAERGEAEQAKVLHERARVIVQELLDSLYQPELRRAFEEAVKGVNGF